MEELDNRMGNSEADEDGGMEEEQDESQQQDDTDGMLGCLIFSVQPNATFDFILATAGLVATLATAALGQP